MSDFNAKSTDAMFATIMERMETQNREANTHRIQLGEKMDTVLERLDKIDNRVLSLEQDRWYQRGIVAAVGVAAVAAWEFVKAKWWK